MSQESTKEPVCDVKVNWIKLEGGTAVLCPVAGKIRGPGSAQAPSVPLNISPMVWLRQPKGESRKRTEESLLSSGRFRLSPATGWPGPLPVFIQLTFTPHAAFFGTFLGSKKVPYPPVPPYSLICQNFSKSVNPCNKCRGCIVYISRERGGASCTQRGDRQ